MLYFFSLIVSLSLTPSWANLCPNNYSGIRPAAIEAMAVSEVERSYSVTHLTKDIDGKPRAITLATIKDTGTPSGLRRQEAIASLLSNHYDFYESTGKNIQSSTTSSSPMSSFTDIFSASFWLLNKAIQWGGHLFESSTSNTSHLPSDPFAIGLNEYSGDDLAIRVQIRKWIADGTLDEMLLLSDSDLSMHTVIIGDTDYTGDEIVKMYDRMAEDNELGAIKSPQIKILEQANAAGAFAPPQHSSITRGYTSPTYVRAVRGLDDLSAAAFSAYWTLGFWLGKVPQPLQGFLASNSENLLIYSLGWSGVSYLLKNIGGPISPVLIARQHQGVHLERRINELFSQNPNATSIILFAPSESEASTISSALEHIGFGPVADLEIP